MKQIKSINDLKEGTKLLWELADKRAKIHGKYCIVTVAEINEKEIYLQFPSKIQKNLQYMDLHSIKVNAQIITLDEDPEFFL